MITATVRYKLPSHIDYAACRAHFHKIAPGFRQAKGSRKKSTSSGVKAAGLVGSINGRGSRTRRRFILGLGLTESSSGTACIRRSSSTRFLR